MARSVAFLWVVVCVATTTAIAGDKPAFKITTKRDTDRVAVKIEQDTTVFSVQSPFGISNAVIERTADKWPAAVVIRLHLKGLESFQASNGQTTLSAAASAQNASVRVWQDGKEDQPLDNKSRYWMAIRAFGGNGKPTNTTVLKDGYFEIRLPRALFDGDPKSITLDWIDFLRT